MAEIYFPAVSADAVIQKATRLYSKHRLTRIDANTIGCLTGGVSYIPLPPGTGDGANFAGLMTIGLPAGIIKGQLYKVIVRQLTNAQGRMPTLPPIIDVAAQGKDDLVYWRRVLGTFQINIPVSTKELMLEKEELRLSIFRWIGASIPVHSRWFLVFQRYLHLLGIKVKELGGDPGKIKPSQNGYDGVPPYGKYGHPSKHRCFTGKVSGLIFDRFGDFEGFVLDTEDGDRSFKSGERAVQKLVSRACAERIITTVCTDRDEPRQPRKIILKGHHLFYYLKKEQHIYQLEAEERREKKLFKKSWVAISFSIIAILLSIKKRK